MPFNWRYVMLLLLLKFGRGPHFIDDLFPSKEYNGQLFNSVVPMDFSTPDGHPLTFQNVFEPARVWEEMDHVPDNDGERDDYICEDTQAIFNMRKNFSLLSDHDICLEVDSPLTGNASLFHGGDPEGELTSSTTKKFTKILHHAHQHVRLYYEGLFAKLPEEWQPDQNFWQTFTFMSVVDIVVIVAFIRRRVPTVKGRACQLTEQQLVQRVNQLTHEKHDALLKLSHLNKKYRRCEKKFKRLQKDVSSTENKNKELKASVKEMEERYKHLQEEKDLLQKMDQAELEWQQKMTKMIEEMNGFDQIIKEGIQTATMKMEETEQMYKTQMEEYEEQYKKTLKLVSEFNIRNEEHEQRRKEEIAEKSRKFMEEVWLKEVIRNGEFVKEPFEPSRKWQYQSDGSNQTQHQDESCKKQEGRHILFSTKTSLKTKKQPSEMKDDCSTE